MKTWFLKLSLCLGFFLLCGISSISTVSASEPTRSFSIAPPQEDFDMSDLDLRDSDNRPVKSVQHVQEVQRLFVRSLNQLLLDNLTPMKRIYLKILSQSWDVTSGWLKGLQVFVIHLVYGVIQKFGQLITVSSAATQVIHCENKYSELSIRNPHQLSLLLKSSVQILR